MVKGRKRFYLQHNSVPKFELRWASLWVGLKQMANTGRFSDAQTAELVKDWEELELYYWRIMRQQLGGGNMQDLNRKYAKHCVERILYFKWKKRRDELGQAS
jgi:hypothetical protein